MNRIAIVAAIASALLGGCTGMPARDNAIPSTATDNAAVAPTAAKTDDGVIVAAATDVKSLGVRDLGPAPANDRLPVALVFRYRNAAQLDRLVAEQSNILSPSYRHWLTNEQFNATYAPLRNDYARAAESIERSGLRVAKRYDNRTVLDVSGTVAQLERYFRTSIHRVTQKGYGARYVNVRPAYAPRELRELLLSADGLDTVAFIHPFLAPFRPGHASLLKPDVASSAPPLYGPPSTQTNGYGYGPTAFSRAYDLPALHAAPGGGHFDGTGRTVAIVMDSDFNDDDVAAFLQYFGITRTGPPTVRVPVGTSSAAAASGSGSISPDTVEATLDAETIVSNAPGVALRIYEPSALVGPYVTDAYNQVVADNLADVVNSSFGGCEVVTGGYTGPKYSQSWNAIVEQGAAKGVTFSTASGDSGGALCANAPASVLDGVAVGGTTLNITGTGGWAAESGWGGLAANGAYGSGGGVSTLFAFPSWQQGVAGTIDRGRNVPDVALDANPYTGAALYINGSWNSLYNPIGGTSLASPLFVAIAAEIDEVQHGRVGFGAGKLYGIWKAKGYGPKANPYFHDITQGDNGVYYAGKGYDLVTGIGSIDGWNLAGAL